MASKSNSLKLKDLKDLNSILSSYFMTYCIHDKMVSGILLNTGSRAKALITNDALMCQFDNIVVKDPYKLKSYLADAKVTKSEKIDSAESIDLIYHSNDGDKVFVLPRYTRDTLSTIDPNTKYQNEILSECHNGRFGEGTKIDDDILEAIANKKFVCIGGVIFAKSELPMTEKCDDARYWNLYGDENETNISSKLSDDFTRNYLVIKLSFEDLVIYKLVAYAFPATEFNM